MKTYVLALILAVSFGIAHASGPSKWSTIIIHTSAVCEMCEVTIEGALKKAKGVKTAALDVPTKDVTVTYDAKKIDTDALRKVISMAGYDADNVPADQEAYDNLHACCRKGSH